MFATYSGTKWVGALVKRGLSYKNGYKVLFTGPEDSVITQIGSPWSRKFFWDDSVNDWVDPAVVVYNYAHYALRGLCSSGDVAWEDRPVVGHKNGWCAILSIIHHT